MRSREAMLGVTPNGQPDKPWDLNRLRTLLTPFGTAAFKPSAVSSVSEEWWTRGDSNPWPRECDSRALPTELRAHAIWGKASMPLTAEQPGRVRWFLYSR